MTIDLTADLEALLAQRDEIQKRIDAIYAAQAAEQALVPVGGILYWGGKDGRGPARKGRVTMHMTGMRDGISYIVQNIRKDGTEGKLMQVHPYMKPRATP